MQRNDGVMIINEFESLEALYGSSTNVDEGILQFWNKTLQELAEVSKII